jgi:hypothetical protein
MGIKQEYVLYKNHDLLENVKCQNKIFVQNGVLKK